MARIKPNVKQPIAKQTSAANIDKKKPTPKNFNNRYAAQYHARKYLRTNSLVNTIVFSIMACGFLSFISGGGEPPKSVCTVADAGVAGTVDARLSCHEIQRIPRLSGGRSACLTSRVFVVASISAGAVIHDGSVDFVLTRSSRDGTSSGGPTAAWASASASRACSGLISLIF